MGVIAERTLSLVKPAPAPPRVMRISVTETPKGWLVRRECVAGHHDSSVLYTAEELDELGERIREKRGGDKAGGGP